jgi:hypothetical protein
MGQWYNYDLKSQKALITLMERSKTPMLITAGKILPLSLETFTMVITVERLSYSFFYEKKNFQVLRRTYSLVAVLKNYQ